MLTQKHNVINNSNSLHLWFVFSSWQIICRHPSPWVLASFLITILLYTFTNLIYRVNEIILYRYDNFSSLLFLSVLLQNNYVFCSSTIYFQLYGMWPNIPLCSLNYWGQDWSRQNESYNNYNMVYGTLITLWRLLLSFLWN